MTPLDEARRIFALTRGDGLRTYELLQQQLSVLVLRTQVMLSLSGIVITVTGFSGRAIAQTSPLARLLVAAGILVVLLSAAVAIGGVLRLRWLTQSLGPNALDEAVLVQMIASRDAKARFLNAALVLFVLGFACYCVAIALMLVAS